jgi:hypothetical protein
LILLCHCLRLEELSFALIHFGIFRLSNLSLMSKLELKLSDVLVLVLHGLFSVALFITIFEHFNSSLTALASYFQELTTITMRSYKGEERLDKS